MLAQRKNNVLTSGYIYSPYGGTSGLQCIASSQLTDILLSPEWQEIYSAGLFRLFATMSVFYLVNETTSLQLSGPSPSFTRPSQVVSLSLRSCFYRLSFPHHCGFSSHHLFNELLELNQAVQLAVKTAGSRDTPSMMISAHRDTPTPSTHRDTPTTSTHRDTPTPFAYRDIRCDTVRILVHEIFRPVYPNWQRFTAKQEMMDVRRKCGLEKGERMPRVRPISRLDGIVPLLGRLLYNVKRAPYFQYLNKFASLPKEYEENRTRWQWVWNRRMTD